MNPLGIVRQFQFNEMTLTRLLADVSHEESLRVPELGGNSINWTVGHILVARSKLLGILGADVDWQGEMTALYGQESGPLRAAVAKKLPDLVERLESTMGLLAEAIAKASSTLNDPCDILPHVKSGGTVGDRIGSYVCHEAYHAGQIGMLRRLLGKPGLF
jgi:uncharacterized damage-inducible protein DinB